MKKVLVTGADGQLGSELRLLANRFEDLSFLFTDVSSLDITSQKEVENLFSKSQFDFCINCAAFTAVDLAEEERDTAHLINVLGCETLAKASKKFGVTLIHISTDFVFDGQSFKPVNEEEIPIPLSEYGRTKLRGEQVIQEMLEEHVVIRTSWLYSSFGKNFVKTMIHLGETRDHLRVVGDQVGTPTYARDLASVLITIIRSDNPTFGLFHYSNQGVASWYDFASAIFEYSSIKVGLESISTEEYPTPATRPHYSVLDKRKIMETYDLFIPHWRQSLKKCLQEIEKAE